MKKQTEKKGAISCGVLHTGRWGGRGHQGRTLENVGTQIMRRHLPVRYAFDGMAVFGGYAFFAFVQPIIHVPLPQFCTA